MVLLLGTPFMDLLAASLRYWVSWKLNNDPGWKNVGTRRDVGSCVRTVAETQFAAGRHYLRCFRSRRRRAQNHGLDSKTTIACGPRPEHQPCHLWSGKWLCLRCSEFQSLRDLSSLNGFDRTRI